MTCVDTSSFDLTDEEFDAYMSVAFSNAARVTPGEREKLKGLLKHYAKKKHPFTACVADNTKRFGEERAERICAVLKDIIRGTTKWRGNKDKDKGAAGIKNLSEEFALEIDEITAHYFAEWLDEEWESIEEVDEISTEDVSLAEEGELEPADEVHDLMAELYFASTDSAVEEDNLIWKTVLREGEWKFSPGRGQQPVARPIRIVKNGRSDAKNLVISMSDIKKHFEAGIVEHVTVPTSHADKVLENTGYVKALKWGKDEQGRATLVAGIEFTEPEVKDKAKRGTIANTSGGVLFDYIHKESGKKYSSVLAHVALTNHPWLNGMKPFGVEASEDLEVISFSEEPETTEPVDDAGGGENVSTTETPTFFDELGLSEDEIRDRLTRYNELEAENKKNRIDSQVRDWEAEHKAPAVIQEAKSILMAADESLTLNLSENGKEETVSIAEAVKRLVAVTPAVQLAEEQVTEEQQSEERPPADTVEENEDLTLSERADIAQLVFEEGMPEAEAIKTVRSRRVG